MLQTLEVAYGPQTAVVWLARPEVRNALDARLIAELTETFMTLGDDREVRAIVLAGRGKAFCAGADLNAMRHSAQAGEADNRADALAMATLLHTVHTCPKPTIARVHGACMAGGMGLAAACDIAVAAREARFALTETRLGLIPAMISPYVLRAIGPRAASRWFLSAEVFEAAEAWRMGLVHELCETDELDARINELLGHFMLASPHALAESKRLIRELAGRAIDAEVLEDTAARLAAQRATEDGREGIAAFLEKRAPRWVPREE
ncbi:enoyl-CoA hydratase/isomerase family protein [Bordetella petrii]|uniref:Enoyl-CoA hydratase n=1 Tax=Bordetella petrii (strain ATCC BAA-461 / DSM 12804 / CCUG 43448 / CIP 107267 / Se-1111R) TaxID=340100 RepID=A9IP53_BORPD|nr:enoyl-CoA hydratase/isomerase family protein [Bordetella petrii]CAP42906.1 enoyl-CoA hydratase [Bordetella petrii]